MYKVVIQKNTAVRSGDASAREQLDYSFFGIQDWSCFVIRGLII